MGTVGHLKRLLVATGAAVALLIAATVSGAAPGTDASVQAYDQCANDKPPSSSTACPGGWINGILNANNSHYGEDDVTPQRVLLELPAGSPLADRTVEISYLTRKSGHHAYDSLATWNHTQTTADQCQSLSPCPGGSPSTFPIPLDPTVVADSSGSGSATSGHQLTGQVFTMYGGTITGVSSYTHDDASGSSDEYAHVTVTYSVPSTDADTDVLLLFGGHLAASIGPRGWGPGLGAGNISGGPYHIRITQADSSSVGNRDNQIMAGAIVAPANIVINKTTVGGDDTFNYTATGGISSPFSITTSGGSGSKSFLNITAGNYSVTESGPSSDWVFTNLVCDDPTSNSSVSGQTANIALDPGETVTCTYTNKHRPRLTVIKHVVNDSGGSAAASNWTMHVAGPTPLNFPGAESPGTSNTVNAGSYQVTETGPSGYALTYSGDCDSSGNVSLALGESKTCTLTNNDQAASLTVIKHVVNDNGGSATASNFTMTINGVTAVGGNSFAGAESPGVTKTLSSVGSYNVTESSLAGYTQTGASADCSGSIALGEHKTCTITNDDQAASLTVIKHVVNDNGGTKVASDFPMHVTGSSPSPANFNGAESPGTSVAIGPGSYNVTETQDPGYTASFSADCSGSIALGQHKTCTVTNDDKAPKLTLVKHVVNDNGGTALASAWTLTATGPTSFSGPGPSVSSGASFDQGSYDLSESGPAGYSASDWVCSKGQVDGDTVSVGLGDDVTCTITNDDQAPKLTLVKHVVNDDGGTAVASEWTLTATGPTGFSGPGPSVSSGPGFGQGSYDLSESGGPDGYSASDWVCSKGQVDGDTVSVGLADDITCTITNDDEAPSLTVIKHVVNDDGGVKVAPDFPIHVDGSNPDPADFNGAESPGTSVALGAGAYQVTETEDPGYTASYSADCSGTIALGESKTCTITNDDKAATLIVKKVVVNDNGGTKVASDFTFSVNGGAAQHFEADGQNDLTVDAGTYNVVEPAVAGYTTSYSNCSNLLIPNGGSATCTVTNNDVPKGVGSISVSKSANPTTLKEPGGPVTFSVTITNTSVDVNVTITNVVDDKFGDLDDDGGNGCFDVPINLVPGEHVNCTFQKNITGQGGTSHVDTVTASGHDANGHPLSASDDARVDITPLLIDLVVVKDATSPTKLNGVVTYTMTVTNKGPDTATNVQLADPAPAGITYLTATPSQGSCAVTAVLITCNLGTLAAGQTVTIKATGKATQTGRLVNTATVTGSGGRETNPADNVDSAETLVTAPVTPPTKPTPTPKPKPQPCLRLTVSPKMIKADGKPDRVVAKVTAGTKAVAGVKVQVRGAGVRKTARTNAKGVAVIKINPKKAGLITISTPESNHSCGARRIGVVGVFLPPVTG